MRHDSGAMSTATPAPNVQQAVPFFMVTDMVRSLHFYVDGLGFALRNKWTPDAPDKIRWCWLELGGAALMLQEYRTGKVPSEKKGQGVSVWFQCRDSLALYDEFRARGLEPREPFVGNSLWDVAISDPDGYSLHFESPTDVPEETTLSEWLAKQKGA
jgi:lactoylglutathione lyase